VVLSAKSKALRLQDAKNEARATKFAELPKLAVMIQSQAEKVVAPK